MSSYCMIVFTDVKMVFCNVFYHYFVATMCLKVRVNQITKHVKSLNTRTRGNYKIPFCALKFNGKISENLIIYHTLKRFETRSYCGKRRSRRTLKIVLTIERIAFFQNQDVAQVWEDFHTEVFYV